jgi:hypothetical protein
MKASIRRVEEGALRAIFNEYLAMRIQKGDLVESLEESGHPSPKRSGQPHCTRSEYLEYREQDGTLRVGGHRYRRPDGVIPTKNGLDPKWILHEGVIYKQGRD